jgi:serine/threonine protein kinase
VARGVLSVMHMGTLQESSIGIGSIVGPCRLREPIGSGGMGVVYEAELAGGDRVAVKLLRREWLGDGYMIERFRTEAIAGRLVSHPNVASVFERGETADGQPFLVMERVRGESLGMLLEREGPLAPGRAAAIIGQILQGLDATHRAGIVHGDVKGDNVLIRSEGDCGDTAVLIDFGLAHIEAVPDRTCLGGDQVAGTPDYMAPEIICGRGLSPASDLYAVGVMLYELLTGQTPFRGGTSAQVLQRHIEVDPEPLSTRVPGWDVPRQLERIVMRALAKDVRSRFPSAQSFAMALEQVMPQLAGCPACPARPDAPRERDRRDLTTMRWSRRGAPTLPRRRRFAAGTPLIGQRSVER